MARLQYQDLSPDQIDWDATYKSQNPNWVQDLTPNQIDWESTESRRHRSVARPAPEPDVFDTAAIIGWEVIPALAGAVWFGLPGGAAGSAFGNYMSQQYRIERGFQEDLGLGELGAATALGAFPVGKFEKVGTAARTGIRGAQGAGLATTELYARTYLDEDRAPTRDEIASTVLFGGAFGGGLGAIEAKWLSKNLGGNYNEGDTHPQVEAEITKQIDEAGGVENFQVGSPLLQQMNLGGLESLEKSSNEVAKEVLKVTERKLLDESETFVKGLARGDFSTPSFSRGALESFGTPTEQQRILGEPSFGEGQRQARDLGTVEQMANLQKTFDDQLAQQDEIFTPLMREVDIGMQKVGDNARLREVQEKIAMLDHKHGKNKGASNQRKKLNDERKRILKRNNLTLDDLEAQMQASQMPPTRQDTPLRDRPMEQADPMTKSERMAEEKLGRGYEKYFNVAMPIGAGGAAAYGLLANEEDDEEFKQAGIAPILGALMIAAGVRGPAARRLMRRKEFKQANAQAKRDPKSIEPIAIKSQRVEDVANREIAPPGAMRKIFDDVLSVTSNVVTPISRQTKNLDKKLKSTITYHFRELDNRVGQKTSAFLKSTMPFMKSMREVLKGKPKLKEEFEDLLKVQDELGVDFDEMVILVDRLNLPDGLSDKIKTELKQMRETFKQVRGYGREEGGFDVGDIKNYFPLKIKPEDYKYLRKAMDEDPDLRPASNEIDKAIDEFAAKNNVNKNELTEEELAEITSKVIRGYPVTGSIPGNFQPRTIFDAKTRNKIKRFYMHPEDALESYIRTTVEAVERKKFLGAVKPAKGQGVSGEGFEDVIDSDIGMRANVDKTLANAVAQDLLKGTKFGQEDVEKLRDIIQARFSGGTEKYSVRTLKNAGYIQVMTNLGSAITQIGDQVFSIHFNGFGNHFRTLFNRKDMFNFADLVGLSNREFENLGNSDKIGKLLDSLFRKTGLKQLDLFAKNAYMNAAWRKYHNLANKKNGSPKLAEELRPYFGDRTDDIVRAVRENAPSNKKPPAEVTELVFHKLLDIAPATATEVPAAYMKNPNLRIMYMLKTFTIKQIDAFRTAGIDNMQEGGRLYLRGREEGNKSKQEAGVRLAAKGMKDVVQLATIFAAANVGTDVIKDLIYGRPIKRDELIENNLWKLFGMNRYIIYNAQRRGAGKAFIDLLAPPTALFDRAATDISALAGDKEYKGAMLQGTPLDLIYWRYLGGLDKIKD
tara:strand:- start:63 stop:3743 length:3681 start_codon:yes stop_codon:yes gene_type:complete